MELQDQKKKKNEKQSQIKGVDSVLRFEHFVFVSILVSISVFYITLWYRKLKAWFNDNFLTLNEDKT